jgi:hypothetical protein
MNKRIRELAEKAGIDFMSSHNSPGKEFCEAWPEQLERFAHLVEEDFVNRLLKKGASEHVKEIG